MHFEREEEKVGKKGYEKISFAQEFHKSSRTHQYQSIQSSKTAATSLTADIIMFHEFYSSAKQSAGFQSLASADKRRRLATTRRETLLKNSCFRVM